jgi:hypothetical protein
MSKEIKTELLIQAEPEKIWKVFTQFEDYPKWNPFVKSIQGNVELGATIIVKLSPPGAKGMIFKPKVLAFQKNTEFRWLGKLLFKGLFDGEHIFQLIDHQNGTTTFIHSERFTGILVPLFWKQLDNQVRQGFIMMNAALKERVEGKAINR